MTVAIQTEEYRDASADGNVANAEPFTAQFCEDAAELDAIEPGMTCSTSRPAPVR